MNEQNPADLPPFTMTALYLLRSAGTPTVAKLGIVRTPYADLRTVLKRVRARVRAAVPGERPLRMRDLPPTEVWVVRSPVPRLLRELETYLVARLGARGRDPLRMGRREFIAPHHVELAHALVDAWRAVLPAALTSTLYSSDGGATYAAPQMLLPGGECMGEAVQLRIRADKCIYVSRSLFPGAEHRAARAPAQHVLELLVGECRRLQRLQHDLNGPRSCNNEMERSS